MCHNVKVILFILLITCSTSVLADKNGRYSSQGLGAKSCGQFVQAQRNQNYLDYGTWFTGFITGANLYRANTYDILAGTDTESALLWMEKYCERLPLESVSDAAQRFVIYKMSK